MSSTTPSPGENEIWLVRHGQSVSNANQPTELPGLSGLTELGRRQAGLFADSFVRAPDTVVVSPYVRSRMTAKPLLDRYPFTRVLTWPIQEFTYLDPAKYGNTTAKDRRPSADAYWERLAPDYRDGLGAETFLELAARVEAFTGMLPSLSGFTVIVSHGTFLRASYSRLLTGSFTGGKACMERFAHLRHAFPLLNTAVMPLRFDNGRPWISETNLAHLPEDLRT